MTTWQHHVDYIKARGTCDEVMIVSAENGAHQSWLPPVGRTHLSKDGVGGSEGVDAFGAIEGEKDGDSGASDGVKPIP